MNNFQEIHKPFIEEGPTSIKDDAIVQAFGSERRGSLHDTNETGNEGSLDNAKCKLLNWDGTKVVVAEGTSASIDSKALIHHVPLGPGCWKVWVNQVILNAPLFCLILGCVCLRMLLEVLFLGQHISLALTFSRNPNIYR
ncbi:unnamed protein product [Camellia sinensis]